MLNSRDVDRLRADVAVNCRVFVQRCKVAGYPVLVTGTVRDDEYQQQCYERGTGGRPPATFHSVKAGLAFDVCKNVKGQEYNDAGFWKGIAAIGKAMGFTWGGDWKRKDMPHFQWDNHGKYTGADIKAGRYPPKVPACQDVMKEDDDMDEAMFNKMFTAAMAKYEAARAAKGPNEWAEDAWNRATEQGIFDGSMPQAPLTREQNALVLDRLGLLR